MGDETKQEGCEKKKKIKVTLPKGMEGCVDTCCVKVVFCEETTEPEVEVKEPCEPAPSEVAPAATT